MFSIKDTLIIINQLDIPEQKRKYYPRTFNILVNYDGEIVEIVKYKNSPSEDDYRRDYEKFPKTFQFTANPGMYKAEEDLIKKINCFLKEDLPILRELKKSGKLKNKSMALFLKNRKPKSI